MTGSLVAEDWPQWMGAKRDNVWREQGVIEKFPAGGRVYVTDYVTSENVKVSVNNGQKT
ncbi:MAG: hypothetical protein JKY95_18400 [Planctomycetaceae bacterium]|nr:hypothetical protein [Planctomycetaceae bacterium]